MLELGCSKECVRIVLPSVRSPMHCKSHSSMLNGAFILLYIALTASKIC